MYSTENYPASLLQVRVQESGYSEIKGAGQRDCRHQADIDGHDHGEEKGYNHQFNGLVSVPLNAGQVGARRPLFSPPAGAILSLAQGQRHPNLDGNVKRVLARYCVPPDWPGRAAVQHKLWALAEAYTTSQRVGDYNQAKMDLGAMLCTRVSPRCRECPVAADCRARQQQRQADFPGRRPPGVLRGTRGADAPAARWPGTGAAGAAPCSGGPAPRRWFVFCENLNKRILHEPYRQLRKTQA